MPLTDTHIRNSKPAAKPFKLSDGGGMYLLVTPDGARYWRMDYRFARKRRTLALGVYPTVTLAGARESREEARRLLAKAIDPGAAKKASQRAARIASENTFEAIAREWISRQRRRLAPKYSALLLARLEADIFPHIGSRPIAEIDAPQLLEVLRRVEKRGVIETARRLRQICGQVFRYAIAAARGNDDPTTALRGALGAPGKSRGHAAMPLKELPEFLSALETYDGDPRTRLALRLMVLTFVRTTELRAARWSEFENLDGSNPLWRIPAERMKMKREHIVPLAPQAVAFLRELRALPGSEASSGILCQSIGSPRRRHRQSLHHGCYHEFHLSLRQARYRTLRRRLRRLRWRYFLSRRRRRQRILSLHHQNHLSHHRHRRRSH